MVFGGLDIDSKYCLNFNYVMLKRTDCVKYLGVLIDNMLSWKSHINFIVDKVNKGIGMLSMVKRIFPVQSLLSIYYSFIYSYISNAIIFWGSACDNYLNPLIIAQKKAIRIIGNVSRLTHCAPVAKSNNILLINDVYKLSLACMMFRVNSASSHPVLLNNISKSNVHFLHSTRSAVCNKFWVPRVLTNYCQYFVIYQGIILWNSLPTSIINLKSFVQFKKQLKLLLFQDYF